MYISELGKFTPFCKKFYKLTFLKLAIVKCGQYVGFRLQNSLNIFLKFIKSCG